MAEVTLIKQRVDPEKVSQLREWTEGIQDREEEVLKTLKNEGVYTETAFLEETAEGTFLVTYIEAKDLEQVWEAFEQSTHEIDNEHEAAMQDCLVNPQNVGDFEQLYHQSNPDR